MQNNWTQKAAKGHGTSDVPTGIDPAKQPSDVLFFTIFSLWDECVLIGCRFYDVGCWGVGGWKGGTAEPDVEPVYNSEGMQSRRRARSGAQV